MEAATTAATADPIDEVREPVGAQPQLYRWATWLHVGPGAEDCEAIAADDKGAVRCDCSDTAHFHAWCRLPNPVQHREIRETALAARARKARMLRDPEAAAYAILEEELAELARLGEEAKPDIVDELIGRDWAGDYLEALQDVAEIEDQDVAEGEEPGKRFEHVERDRARYRELDDMDPDSRPSDEYEAIKRHLAAHQVEVDKRLGEIEAPKREALSAKPFAELIELVRDQRIDAAAQDEYLHVYALHSWLVGTRVGERSEKRRFDSIAQLTDADAVVIDALQDTFIDLERTKRGGAGNS